MKTDTNANTNTRKEDRRFFRDLAVLMTLAALAPRPLAIGVGLCAARIATIFPQPHDIAMQVIVTETGPHFPKESP